MLGRGATPAVTRIAFALAALTGVRQAAGAGPGRCELAMTATPSSIPAGSRLARIQIPASPGVQVRASSGTLGPLDRLGPASVTAEFTASLDPPPAAIVAAVSRSSCGFLVLRTATTPDAVRSARPVTLLVVEPATAPADRDNEASVYVFAIDEKGTPRRGSAPAFRPGAGSITRVEPLGPGVWRGRWNVPAGETRLATIEVGFGSEPPVSSSLARSAGLPATIEIGGDPSSPALGPGTPSAVIVRIRDAVGNLTDGALQLESDVAALEEPVRLERGIYRAPVEVPPTTRQSSIVITATAGRAVASTTLQLAPRAAAKITVVPHEPIRAGGSDSGKLEVLAVAVVDARGNPASDIPVGSAERGEVWEALAVSPGHWALPYRPPRISEDTVDAVVIRAGNVSTKVDLELLGSRLSVSLGLKAGAAVGGRVGPAVGVETGVWTRFGHTQLGLVLEVSWWTLSQSSTATVGGAASSYKATQNYFPLLLSLAWRTPFAGRWMFWASTGGGGCVVTNSAQLEGQPAVNESSFTPAATISLSSGPRLGPGFLFLEARATWIGDPKLSTLSGSSTTFLGLLGYRFDVD